MQRQNKTYEEGGWFYAVVWVNGHSYYCGGFKSRSTARRKAIREQAKFDRTGPLSYNPRYI